MNPLLYFLYYVPASQPEHPGWLAAEIAANFETEASIGRLVEHCRQRVPELAPLNIDSRGWTMIIGEQPVFNYTYAFGTLAESILPSYHLEVRRQISYGAPPQGIWLSAHKHYARSLMQAAGYAVPDERLLVGEIERAEAEALCRSFEPASWLVLKPAYEESSIALRLLACEPESIYQTVNTIFHSLCAPLLLQEYIAGEDVTVPLIGRRAPGPLPAVVLKRERSEQGTPFVFAASAKATKDGLHYESMQGYPHAIRQSIYAMAQRAFELTEQRDYARLDLRLTPQGVCYFLEMNANPQLGLDKASFAVSARALELEVCDVFEMIIHDRPPLPTRQLLAAGL